VPADTAPEGVAVSPDHSHVYIADNGSARVSVLDARTDEIVATVPVGKDPSGVGLSPDGRYLYVADGGSNTVSVVDTQTSHVIAAIPVGVSPVSVAVSGRNWHICANSVAMR
jgi:YVTN family beta-propeller protein